MTAWTLPVVLLLVLQEPSPRATVSAQAFAGTWVGTQSWAIDNPPPGARPDQPVSLTIDVVDGKVIGSMTPFMGGQDGATFTTVEIVGDELHASAMVGRPRPSGRGGRRGPANWKDATKIRFTFKNAGVDMIGTADVMLNDVKWLSFKYDLSKKRSRY